VVAKVRERLAVSKYPARMFEVERLNLKKLSELGVRKHKITISNSFGELKCSAYINRAWGNIKKNITVSVKDSLGWCAA